MRKPVTFRRLYEHLAWGSDPDGPGPTIYGEPCKNCGFLREWWQDDMYACFNQDCHQCVVEIHNKRDGYV